MTAGEQQRYVGRKVSRVDGPAKVRGEATFTAEFDLPGLTHGVLIEAEIAHGRVSRVAAQAALEVPGVLGVFSHESGGFDLQAVKGYPKGPAGTSILPFQDADVKFRGQPVALVVAETLEAAQHAALLVEIEYEEQEHHVTLDDGIGGFRLADLRTSRMELDHSRGKAGKVLDSADEVLEATYDTPTHHHNPMEMHAVIAEWDGEDRVTLYEPTQWMQSAQGTLAATLGLEPDNVHVISPFVGGGFGSKATTWPHVLVAVLAARAVKRPVKLVLTRAQMFAAVGYRPATRVAYRAALEEGGKVSAMELRASSQTGPVDVFPEQVGSVPKMLYATENLDFRQQLVHTHAGPNIMMRAPGEAPGAFGLEVLMDELAEQAGMDPLAFRRANHTDTDLESGKPYSSKHLLECYEKGAAAFGWDRRTPGVGSMRDGDTLIGWGMATSVYPVYASAATARARLCPGGSFEIEAGSHDIGTGTYSILAQIAADALGVDIGRVRVKLGDSHLPKNGYSGGSRTAGSVGSAVLAAAQGLRQEVLGLALQDPRSPLHGVAPIDVSAEGGELRAGERRDTYSDILARSGQHQHEVYREVIPNGGSQKQLDQLKKGKDGSVEAVTDEYARYSFGAVFVEVRVDPDFMTPRVSRVVGAFDIGQVINAKTAHSQLTGGMIWGVGMALHEQGETDPASGLLTNSNFADYHIPVNADIGTVEAIMLDHPDFHVSALGARGAGEIGIVGTPAAVANAVYHATGKRVRSLPITVDKLLG
ncbi:xanthine dehydrogenase family protein molybdopterin-binding subunit [Deinococcus petrolearius]|uniref:Xanthine dehydrogenase family protein molybdopterin-binding subunit n=1 Tax=Deinococcus petrolearius TaxID=1751295 RepID=A0ABW1DFK6_9DEIO